MYGAGGKQQVLTGRSVSEFTLTRTACAEFRAASQHRVCVAALSDVCSQSQRKSKQPTAVLKSQHTSRDRLSIFVCNKEEQSSLRLRWAHSNDKGYIHSAWLLVLFQANEMHNTAIAAVLLPTIT